MPMTRQHVHLSLDHDTAIKVGSRHGKPVVLAIYASRMHAAGHTFYCAANGVWLTEQVDPDFIEFPNHAQKMLIGYARISKADGSQSLDLQRDALTEAGLEHVD